MKITNDMETQAIITLVAAILLAVTLFGGAWMITAWIKEGRRFRQSIEVGQRVRITLDWGEEWGVITAIDGDEVTVVDEFLDEHKVDRLLIHKW